MEARTRAAEVDVLVVNHHLLAAHIAVRLETGADVVLPRTAPEGAAHAWDCVVVDEAHELGDIARDFFGRRLRALERVGSRAVGSRRG